MFTPTNHSGNTCELLNSKGEKILITVVEAGILRVDSFGCEFKGTAFVNIARFDNFNYKSPEPKKELAKFVFEKINSFHLSKTFISGNLFSEISFVIDKKMFTVSLKTVREEMRYVESI